MISSSKNFLSIVFGLILCLTYIALIQIQADDEDKKKKKEEGLVGEPKLIFDAGLGKFDWKGKNNSYQKNPESVRKPATKELESKAVCPVCEKDISVLTITSSRSAIDYDLCEHFVGDSPYIFDLWTCSMCGYTAYRNTFQKEISDEDKAFTKKYLTAPLHSEIKKEFGTLLKNLESKPLSQKVIPSVAKIKNFTAFIDHRNDIDNKWKAYFFVRAVYAVRNLIAMAPSCTSLNNTFLQISKKVDAQTKIPENEKQSPHSSAYYLNFYLYILNDYKDNSKERIALHLLISQSFNRLGYYSESKSHYLKANEICKNYKDIDDVIKTLKAHGELLELEKANSLKAISYMKDALEEKADYGNNQYAIIYLIGELSRRCEVFSDAYLFLSASKMLFKKEDLIYGWTEEHLARKELKSDDFLMLTPPNYLKQIVIEHNKK